MGTAPPEVVLGDEKGWGIFFPSLRIFGAADGPSSEKGWTQLRARTNASPELPGNPGSFPL